MTYPADRPSPWLLAPATMALILLGAAHQDAVFPSLCFLCMAASYFHSWRASLPKRHPWLMSMLVCAGLFCLCLLYYWIWLLNGQNLIYYGEGLTDFRRLWYQPWLVSTGAMLQAAVLLWSWHLPRRSTGLIFTCMGMMAISSGNILPSSYVILNLYALFGGSCLLSLFVLGGACHSRREQPLWEQCRQSLVVLSCIAVIGAGTWYLSASLQHVGQMLDTLFTNLMSNAHYWDTIGVGDSIRIAHRRHVKLSRRVVATLSGSQSPVYLRTQVMVEYHRHRWTTAPVPPPQPLYSHQHTRPTHALQNANRREVHLQINLQGAVPLPYGMVRLDVPESLACLQRADDIVQCSPASQLTSYAFESAAPYPPIPFGIGFALPVSASEPSVSTIAPSLQQALTAPDAVLSQLQPLARQIVGNDARHALTAAQKIQQHFRRHFTYSLDVELSSELDPIVDFIRHRKPAYCEYFASGMALMLRALGIPARVVGGFLVWEYNALLQQWIIRQRDAHAWVEVYDDVGQRWVGFDATPAFRQEQFSRPGLVGFLDQSQAWAALQAHIVIKKLYQIDFIAWFMRRWPFQSGFGSIAVHGFILAVGIAAACQVWRRFYPWLHNRWQIWRWLTYPRPSHAWDDARGEAQQQFARLAKLLQCCGLPILPTETLEDYLARLSSHEFTSPKEPLGAAPPPSGDTHGKADRSAVIDTVTEFSQAYQQLRFGACSTEWEARRTFLQERLTALHRATDRLKCRSTLFQSSAVSSRSSWSDAS